MEIGAFEILAVAAIALLFFGPSKLPQLGKSVGEAIRGFKKGLNDVQDGAKDLSNDVKKTATTSSQPSQSTPKPAAAQTFPGATPDAAPDARVTTDVVKEPVGSGRSDS